MGLTLLIYLLIGFGIAVVKKEDAHHNRSTGLERFFWTIGWPVMYVSQFLNWVISIYQDD